MSKRSKNETMGDGDEEWQKRYLDHQKKVSKEMETWKKRCLDHLEKVSIEIEKMKREIERNPEEFGNFEDRLYWAIRGVDPEKAMCSKHRQKITKNEFGEFICGDCIEEWIRELDTCDENKWFVPDDEPTTKIHGIKYGQN